MNTISLHLAVAAIAALVVTTEVSAAEGDSLLLFANTPNPATDYQPQRLKNAPIFKGGDAVYAFVTAGKTASSIGAYARTSEGRQVLRVKLFSYLGEGDSWEEVLANIRQAIECYLSE